MKHLLLALFCGVSFSASSQITYLADTAFATDQGFGGAEASCRAPHMRYNGWKMGRAQNSWLADVFTVPAGATWTFDTVIVYGYQYGSGTTSTFMNCNLQIYDGTPGLGGTVIWGDTSTNVLVSTGFTGIYKVDTLTADGGITGTNEPIMYLKLHLSPAPSLSAGTYWLSWSSACSTSNVPDGPDKVLPGRVNPPGQTARQLYGGTWYYIVDSSNNVGMDMIIKAKEGLEATPMLTANPGLKLSQNQPNPFNGITQISFDLPAASLVNLSVYNMLGQLVATPIKGYLDQGAHQIAFDATCLPDGVYLYKLQTATAVESKQMMVTK